MMEESPEPHQCSNELVMPNEPTLGVSDPSFCSSVPTWAAPRPCFHWERMEESSEPHSVLNELVMPNDPTLGVPDPFSFGCCAHLGVTPRPCFHYGGLKGSPDPISNDGGELRAPPQCC